MRRATGPMVFVCLLLAAATAMGAVRHVPGQYPLIQGAMQAAAAGDTVLVAAGTYGDCTHPTEGPGSTPACVIMKSGVVLRGAGPATIIDAGGLGRGIFVESVTNCRVENLQVRGANAPAYGAGLLVRNVGSTVRASDLLVTQNLDGGVICINGASPVLTRVDCVDNLAKQGGGLAIEDNSSPLVVDCDILDNEAPSGAGVFIRNGSAPRLERCLVRGNVINAPYGNGGGVCVVTASPSLVECVIEQNTTLGYGGGLAFLDGAAGEAVGCVVRDNVAAGDYSVGGGVSTLGANPRLAGLLIAGNRCTGYYAEGGGIDCTFGPAPSIENCTIAGNEPGPAGLAGGVSLQFGADPVISRCIIAFAAAGQGLLCVGGGGAVTCTDIYGNPGGNDLCGTDGGGNFSLDPRFVGTAGDEYTLRVDSPCAPGNHPGGACGLAPIGAVPPGASLTAVPPPAARLRLLGAAPNPFNPRVRVAFALDAPGRVEARLYDLAGRLVRDLTPGELPAGDHEIVWDGRLAAGKSAAAGVYLLEVTGHGARLTQRLVLAR